MKADNLSVLRSSRNWYSPDHATLEELQTLTERQITPRDYPLAASIGAGQVPLFDCGDIRRLTLTQEGRELVMAEWAQALRDGPGIVVLKKAFDDMAALDHVTHQFDALITLQKRDGVQSGDHFAKAGANDRVWNALEKLCLFDPEGFARYYSNEMIALVSEAWLGPAYQITSQVNVVNPGGEAQTVHRDYHLGFQSTEQVIRYPVHVHAVSPFLTLQGAVAHCDMPLESGPTLYKPFTQQYGPGYLATQSAEIREWFQNTHVQLPLEKGDAVFFNPALFHAAGRNHSRSIRRMANLLQVSSPFGRAMENMDRARMAKALYPVLQRLQTERALGRGAVMHAVAACAEGYAFPTNLDRDPPINGLAPQSQQALMTQALQENWEPSRFEAALDERVRCTQT
ncbi:MULTISPECIES: phytanoyl-CoA dioxygenase family protein [Asaia]|uniref:phytanoyl-CoA dioxygenase family protein n=1 Tax=Asaia TaxID=91914 RepID=UPI002553F674|nr:phytanoyl-CoA dioxygenase family protein [Asaia sp. HumB]MDL2170232.1 phytanoyl-CoA dioxygenase family protein [Asaia sp. HumB]